MMTKSIQKKRAPVVLIIMDGWGIAKPSRGNAITLAKTPNISALSKKYPYTELVASGRRVGLPGGQVGNSEAGHMNIGAGRKVEQDSVEISRSIKDGTFFKNPAFLDAIHHVKKNNSKMHLMGLLSDTQSPHMDPEHLRALLKFLYQKEVKNVFLHIFTDGRDSPQYIAVKLLKQLAKSFHGQEAVATIMGRFYAMDRKKAWDRIRLAYDAIVLGKGVEAKDSQEAILQAYNRGETDEFIKPSVICRKNCRSGVVGDNDAILFFNFRSDRARQLAKTFVQPDFNKMNPGSFKRPKLLKNLVFVAMSDFGPDLGDILTAYPSKDIPNTLPMALRSMTQLYLAETEKYAHMTYFFNGGYPDLVGGEERLALASPDVDSYDEKPEMAAYELEKVASQFIKKAKFDFIAMNLANPDMIGHTGNLKAGIKAVEVVDDCVGKLVKNILDRKGLAIITADHGNIEEMINLKTGEVDTIHSTNPVPFIMASDKLKKAKLKPKGVLGDIAPTILEYLEIDSLPGMSGHSLLL